MHWCDDVQRAAGFYTPEGSYSASCVIMVTCCHFVLHTHDTDHTLTLFNLDILLTTMFWVKYVEMCLCSSLRLFVLSCHVQHALFNCAWAQNCVHHRRTTLLIIDIFCVDHLVLYNMHYKLYKVFLSLTNKSRFHFEYWPQPSCLCLLLLLISVSSVSSGQTHL